MAHIQQKDLLSGLKDAFRSSRYSDLRVHCKEDTYHLHRVIVCQRSRFFAACCDGDFKEAMVATINLHDDDPSAVGRMFTYLYTLDYDDGADGLRAQQHDGTEIKDHEANTMPWSSPTQDAAPLDIGGSSAQQHKVMSNVYVYAIAEKYEITALKELARAKFQAASRLSSEFSCSPTVIGAVFGTTPEKDLGLRSIVAEICAVQLEKWLTKEDLYQQINERGDLGLAMLREVAKHLTKAHIELSVSKKRLLSLEQGLEQLIKQGNELNPLKEELEDYGCARFEKSIERIQKSIMGLYAIVYTVE